MPWLEINPMDQKILFIADYLRGGHSFSDLCAHYGISRKTGYKWVDRYQTNHIEGLSEQNRRPKTNPNQTPFYIRHAIIEMRKNMKITPGPKKIQHRLRDQWGEHLIPSKTTIYHILKEADLIVTRKKHRRITPYGKSLPTTNNPNELWTADFKGQFKLATGQWCYPLTIMDHYSRYLLDCYAMRGTTFKHTQRVFTRLFKEHGMPERIRTDNGVPFASTSAGGLSQLSIWWVKLGIWPERIALGKPQQNGRHERMHRTLKQVTTHPPASSFSVQQKRFIGFQQEYNYERPHEGLQQQTPASQYCASNREMPNRLSDPVYPEHFDVRKVKRSGVIYWHNGQVYVSHLLNDEYVGLEPIDDGIWDVYFGGIRLGGFNERNVKEGSTSYWTLKV